MSRKYSYVPRADGKAYLKLWHSFVSYRSRFKVPKTAEEIELFFRSINISVDTHNFKFDREEANSR